MALVPSLLHTLCQGDDGRALLFPGHLPEGIPCRGQWPLGGDELPPVGEARDVVGIDVIGALLPVHVHQFDTRMVVGQDVGETVLGAVDGEVGRLTALADTDVLHGLVFFGETELRVGTHIPHMELKVALSDGTTESQAVLERIFQKLTFDRH